MPNADLREDTITKINEKIESKGCSDWKVCSEDRRYITFKCKCQEMGRTLKQGLFRETWNGCSKCCKKGVSQKVKDQVIKKLHEGGYKFIGTLEGRKAQYECEHGKHVGFIGNILKEGAFNGACRVCTNKKEVQQVLKENLVHQEEEKANKKESDLTDVPIEVIRGAFWGGTHRGTIREDDTHYIAALPAMASMGLLRSQKKIAKSGYDSNESAYDAAQKYLKQESIRRGYTTNQVRDVVVISHPVLPKGYTYREIAIKHKGEDVFLMIESEHLDMFVSEPIYIHDHKKDKTLYAVVGTNSQSKLVHSKIYPEFGQVDHIDRNGLNNLKYNIRDGSGRVNATNKGMQNNNTSGVKGVRYEGGEKARWKAQWVDLETGTRKSRSFSIAKFGNEDAREAAIRAYKENAPTPNQVAT